MPEQNHHEPPEKRRRVAESCQTCRLRKIRCDGQRPICSTCSTRRVTCQYHSESVSFAQQTLEDIQARLAALERDLPRTAAGAVNDSIQPTTHASDTSSAANPSDNATLRYIRDVMHSENPQTDKTPRRTGTGNPYQRSLGPAESCSRAKHWHTFCLPFEAEVDALVEQYKSLAYPLFPTLSIPVFESSYRSCRSVIAGHHHCSSNATFHATVSMVCALGCVLSSDRDYRANSSRAIVFYEEARALAPLDSFDTPTIADVHYLLLTVQYLTFTVHVNRAYHVLAVAIRMAQALGLDRDVYAQYKDQVDCEMARRTWHLCLIFERLFASIYAVAPQIKSSTEVPVPHVADIVHNAHTHNDGQASEQSSIASALTWTISRFQIIEQIPQMDDSGKGVPTMRHAVAVLDLYTKTVELESSLPWYLTRSLDSAPPSTELGMEPLRDLLSNAVALRILHVRLAILRPFILETARKCLQRGPTDTLDTTSPVHDAPERAIRIHVSTLCLHAARAAVSLLHSTLGSGSGRLSCIATHISLSAATVVIASSAIDEMQVSIDEGEDERALEEVFEILGAHAQSMQGTTDASEQLRKFLIMVKESKLRCHSQAGHEPAQGHSAIPAASNYADNYPSIQDFDFGLDDAFWATFLSSAVDSSVTAKRPRGDGGPER